MRSGQGVGSKSRVVLTYVTETIIMPQRIHESLQNQEGRRALSLTKQLNVGQTLVWLTDVSSSGAKEHSGTTMKVFGLN